MIETKKNKIRGVSLALLAALLAGLIVPFNKLLLGSMPVYQLAAITSLSAAFFSGILLFFTRCLKRKTPASRPLAKGKEWIYIALIALTEVAALICQYEGISRMSGGSTASLIYACSTVTTGLIALFFRDKTSGWGWIAIVLITVGAGLLSFNPGEAFSFEFGAGLLLIATACWGLENNLMKKVSYVDTNEVIFFKNLIPGIVVLIISLCQGQFDYGHIEVFYGAMLGIASAGLGMAVFSMSMRDLSSSLATSFYCLNPFVGSILCIIIFKETSLNWNFFVAGGLMLAGAGFAFFDAFHQSKKESAEPPEDGSSAPVS